MGEKMDDAGNENLEKKRCNSFKLKDKLYNDILSSNFFDFC